LVHKIRLLQGFACPVKKPDDFGMMNTYVLGYFDCQVN